MFFLIFIPKFGEGEPILTNIFQMGWNHQLDNLGGGFNVFFLNFHPEIWGRWTHFDLRIFFKGVALKPPTSNQFWKNL